MNLASLRNLILFDGGDTAASHPGRVRAHRWRVAGSYPMWPMALGVFWFVSLAAVLDGFHWSAFALLALASYGNYACWRSIGPWFRSGDVCPGVVVNEEPLLVASYTDLSACDGAYPAVKIKREPSKRFAGETGKFGKRVVSVARYEGNSATALYWSNVSPRAVQCATDDVGEIQRLVREIPAEHWAALQAGVKRLPRPFKSGLYRLTDD
jgi:hypothetical protein